MSVALSALLADVQTVEPRCECPVPSLGRVSRFASADQQRPDWCYRCDREWKYLSPGTRVRDLLGLHDEGVVEAVYERSKFALPPQYMIRFGDAEGITPRNHGEVEAVSSRHTQPNRNKRPQLMRFSR